MDSLFFWEVGPLRVYIIWIVVFAAQILIAEINRRWNWTIFVLWTGIGIIMMPFAIKQGIPILGWFPFAKYTLMVLTATLTGAILVYAKRHPESAHRNVIWIGVILWACLVLNIMEANVRDVLIYVNRDAYYACAANWHCLANINATHGADMLNGLPESRGISAAVGSDARYQALAHNFAARHVGIDPETGFRTIGGSWNLITAVAGLLNCITVTGLGKIMITSNKKQKVRGIIWIDQVWPWIIAYDLWNHAYLYNSLADYTWYCTLALLLACTIPAFTWAKGQWIWFRCFTLMFWIAFYNWVPSLSAPPSKMSQYATMDPNANLVCAWAALIFNVGVFIYWLYKIIKYKRNPITNALFFELGEFRKTVNEHFDDKDKYFLTDMVPETPAELGFEPETPTPPVDGYVTHHFWWGKKDKRYPKLRTPLTADPVLVAKGVVPDPQWDVTLSLDAAETSAKNEATSVPIQEGGKQ